MDNKIIKGDDLMVFVDGKSVAFATNHSLNISAEEISINSKDHGVYGSLEIGKISWEISSENLFSVSGYDKLFDAMVGRTEVEVVFGLKKEEKTVDDVDFSGFTPSTDSTQYKGKAYITSLQASANSGENSTFSVTLKGKGKIEKVEKKDNKTT